MSYTDFAKSLKKVITDRERHGNSPSLFVVTAESVFGSKFLLILSVCGTGLWRSSHLRAII
jgi:hypothetical protein